jgi:tetratricopeptide (TPR) repeat protein
MALRSCWTMVCLLAVGCQVLPVLESGPDSGQGAQLWQQGQTAMAEGRPDQAVAFYEQSLAADPSLTRNHLSLAAAYLESGKDAEACVHLAWYVAAHPDQWTIRTHYAELLLRLHRFHQGRQEYEQLIAEMQEQGDQELRNLIHNHTRLMELAEAEEDEYGRHLQRGIGLFLLARERAAVAEPDGAMPVEGLLCKAAGELTMARSLKPGEARPHWYLYAVWEKLAQKQPALCSLREAGAAAPFTYLTPAEQRSLELACRRQEGDCGQR